jgi:hypothetical protein
LEVVRWITVTGVLKSGPKYVTAMALSRVKVSVHHGSVLNTLLFALVVDVVSKEGKEGEMRCSTLIDFLVLEALATKYKWPSPHLWSAEMAQDKYKSSVPTHATTACVRGVETTLSNTPGFARRGTTGAVKGRLKSDRGGFFGGKRRKWATPEPSVEEHKGPNVAEDVL